MARSGLCRDGGRPGDQPPNQSPRGTLAASAERSPRSRIAVAASANALSATHVRLPPTLIRCAPASKISPTDMAGTARTFTAFVTASQTARISSAVPSPGA